MKNLTLLFLILLSTCASAQIDSTYGIVYPFKMEITDIEILGGIFIDLVEITGAMVRCRLGQKVAKIG